MQNDERADAVIGAPDQLVNEARGDARPTGVTVEPWFLEWAAPLALGASGTVARYAHYRSVGDGFVASWSQVTNFS